MCDDIPICTQCGLELWGANLIVVCGDCGWELCREGDCLKAHAQRFGPHDEMTIEKWADFPEGDYEALDSERELEAPR